MAKAIKKARVNRGAFNAKATLPYSLRLADFEMAMDDVYVMLWNVNEALTSRGLLRIEESVRGAVFSGLLSDVISAALAKHSLGLVRNQYPANPHPDLLPVGRYTDGSAQSAHDGVEVKVTKKPGGGVDMHGDRPAWYAIFRYAVDYETQPVITRAPTRFTNVWLAKLTAADFRKNPRGPLGTRTASPDRGGLAKLRAAWVYNDA